MACEPWYRIDTLSCYCGSYKNARKSLSGCIKCGSPARTA